MNAANFSSDVKEPDRYSRRFTIRLCGRVEVIDRQNELVRIRTRKARALLAILALSRDGLSRARVADLLWPDRADEQARASLRQAVYELRTELGQDILHVSSDHVALDHSEICSDLANFEMAAARVDLAHLGPQAAHIALPLLGGLDDVSSQLDDWLRTERTVLTSRLIDVIREAAEAALAINESEWARKLADCALQLDPLNERSLRTAMRIDAALGDQAGMHRRYRSFAETLATDLEAKPSEESRILREELSNAHQPSFSRRKLVKEDAEAPEVTEVPSAKPTGRLWLFVGAATAMVLAGLAAIGWMRSAPPETDIAVIPFTTLSSGGQYIASGLSEELQNKLAHQNNVRVLGRVSASQFRAGPDLLSSARRFGVTHLLDGSVQLDGQRLRIFIGLTRVADGALVWSEKFDRPATDLFALQTEIAGAVAAKLGNAAPAAASPRKPPAPAVYDRYLAARNLIRDRRITPLKAADGLLREAIAAQPDYAPAHALLAQVLLLETDHPTSYGKLPLIPTRAEAKRHAALAAQLDPSLGDAQAALGLLSYSDAASLPFYRRAVALDPQRAEFHRWLGQSLMATGQYLAAVTEFRHAVAIDPLWGLSYEHLIVGLDEAGEADQIAEVVRQFLRLSADERSRVQVQYTAATAWGQLAEAVRFGKKLTELAPEDRVARFKYATSLIAIGAVGPARDILDPQDWVGQDVLRGQTDTLTRDIKIHGADFWAAQADFWNVEQYLMRTGHGDLVIQALDHGAQIFPTGKGERIEPFKAAALAVLLRDHGRTAAAGSLTDRLRQQIAFDRVAHLNPTLLLVEQSIWAALVGDRDLAFRDLDRVSRTAPDRLLVLMNFRLSTEPAFKSLGDDPRLAPIESRVRANIDTERKKLGWLPLGNSRQVLEN